MSKKKKSDQSGKISAKQKRPTIGFVVSNLTNSKLYDAWLGVTAAARAREANLICYLTGELQNQAGDGGEVLCDLINAENLDGLVVFQWWRNQAQFEKFYNRYRPLPVVNIMRFLDGYPGVNVDNYQGMRDEMKHLIEAHGYRRIACIRGPEGTTADVRYQAYLDALAEYEIPFDPDLVAPGDFQESGGTNAIHLLLDDRQVDLDALVATNDNMAFGALAELQKRGLNVPYDVAVVGFDNEAAAQISSPPLTTVSISYYELGKKGAELLLAQLKGETVAEQTMIPAKQATRRSCGCFDQDVTQIATDPISLPVATVNEDSLTVQREAIVAQIATQIQSASSGNNPEWAATLFDAFTAEVRLVPAENGASPKGIYLQTLNEILYQIEQSGGNIETWQNIISEMRRQCWPYLAQGDAGLWQRSSDLWEQSRVLIGSMAQQASLRKQAQEAAQMAILNEIREAVNNQFDVTELMNILAERLLRLDIPSCYLSIYTDPKTPAENARLMLAVTNKKLVKVQPAGQVFPAPQLVPPHLLPQGRPYNLVVEALYAGEENQGFVLFEAGPKNGELYATLQRQFSNALRGIAQERERKHSEEELLKFKLAIERSGDAIFMTDINGVIIYANSAFEEIYGFSPEETLGQTPRILKSGFIPPEGYVQLWETLLAKQVVSGEIINKTKDGKFITIEGSNNPIVDETGNLIGFLAVHRDITERKQAEANLTKRAAEFETVAQVSATAATSLDADHLLQEVVDLTKSRFDLYHAHIYLLNDVEDALVLTAGAGQVGRQMVAEGRRIPLQQQQSLVAQAARLKRGIIVNDVQQDPNFLPHHLLPETRAEMAVPMLVGDRVLGVLDVQANKAKYFTDEDQRIQTILANQVAIALDNVRLLARTETTLSEAQRLATIVENQTDFMGVSDLEGNALYINPAGLEMMGLPRDYNISALTIVDFFPAEDAEVLINEGVPAARQHGAWTREAELLRVDGETVPVDKSVTVNYDASKQLYSFNIIMRDISTRKAAEADREALLAEVQATIRQYVHQQWEQFLGENYQGNWRVQHQDPHSELKEDVALLEQLQQAVLNRGETQILAGPHGNGHQGHAALVSPIPLRGQVIGTLSLEDIDPDRNWGEDEIALVEAVSEQLALTIENLRLVENTQKRATREQLARQITDKMRTFPDADAIIQTGLDELAKALGASRTYVKLNLAQSQGYSREQETGSREQEAGSI